MPRSFKTKPIDVEAGRKEGPTRLKLEAAAKRKLMVNSRRIEPVGRRGNSRNAS